MVKSCVDTGLQNMEVTMRESSQMWDNSFRSNWEKGMYIQNYVRGSEASRGIILVYGRNPEFED
jgi:hypothetical protein